MSLREAQSSEAASDPAFNARFLRPEDIAKRFVAPDNFARIASSNHALLFGPRGSGKTTLLNMLRQRALRNWTVGQGPGYARDIQFLGIFVRTEVTWSRQLERMREGLPPALRSAFVEGAYVNNVLRCFARDVDDLFHHGLYSGVQPLSPTGYKDDEERFVNFISRALSCSPAIPSLAGLQAELAGRQARLIATARRVARSEIGDAEAAADVPYIDLDLMTAVSTFADALESVGYQIQYALLLDELEIVPKELREYALGNLRSADGRFIFKVSLSPVEDAMSELEVGAGAGAGEDYDPINLAHPNKQTGYPFTARLIMDLARRRGRPEVTVGELLGQSLFGTDLSADLSPQYGTSGKHLRRFRRLSESDRSFARYLTGAGITPETIASVSGPDRAEKLRKVQELVAARNAFRVRDADFDLMEQKRRTHRAGRGLEEYAGAAAVSALLEGNPRWIVNFMSVLLAGVGADGAISRGRQSTALRAVLARVRSRVRYYPVDDSALTSQGNSGRAALDLADSIGAFFRFRVIENDFDDEPPLSVIVDSNIDSRLERLVEILVRQGALVYVPDRDSSLGMTAVKGKRFRLAYLLSASNQLPLYLGRGISLRNALRAKRQEGSGAEREGSAEALELFR